MPFFTTCSRCQTEKRS